MGEIESLSARSILVKCDKSSVELSTEDKIQFKENYGSFREGEIVRIEPELNSYGQYYLKLWQNNTSIKYVRQDGMINLVCDDIIRKV